MFPINDIIVTSCTKSDKISKTTYEDKKGVEIVKIRKKDYIISFIILALIFIANITAGSGLALFIVKAIIAAIVGALIVGTITNFIFKKKLNIVKQ